MSICFLNDKYLEIQDAKISPLDRGFLFGDAIYEVIIAVNRKPFELDAHIERLKKNISKLKYSIGDQINFKEIVSEIISKNNKSPFKNKNDLIININRYFDYLLKANLSNLEKSSKATSRGINCPINYSVAYASYGVKAAIAPEIPNNSATLSFIKVKAPSGLIVSAIKPSPVTARHVVGQALPDLVLGCLYHIIPDKIPAESSGALWTISLRHDGDHPFNSLNVAPVSYTHLTLPTKRIV